MTLRIASALFIAIVGIAAFACGGATPEETAPGGDTSGGDTVAENTGGETDPIADPCAEGGSGEGCEEAGGEGETAEGEGEGGEGEGETSEGEGEGGEGEGGEGETAEGEGAIPTAEEWTAALARGRRAFSRRCDSCHPGGGEDIGPRIRGKRWTAQRLRRQVRAGRGRMRPIPPSRLSNADLDALLVFLQVRLNTVRGLPEPAAEGGGDAEEATE